MAKGYPTGSCRRTPRPCYVEARACPAIRAVALAGAAGSLGWGGGSGRRSLLTVLSSQADQLVGARATLRAAGTISKRGNIMRAVAIDQFGGPETMKVRDLPVPEVGPDEVLIHIEAAGVGA